MTLALTIRLVAPFAAAPLEAREAFESFEEEEESENCAAVAVAEEEVFDGFLLEREAASSAVSVAPIAFAFLALPFFALGSLLEALASATSALDALGATAGGDGRGTFTIFLTTVTVVPVPFDLPVGSRGWDRALTVDKAEVAGDMPLRATATFWV